MSSVEHNAKQHGHADLDYVLIGRGAYKNGEPEASCPYVSPWREAWVEGWNQAKQFADTNRRMAEKAHPADTGTAHYQPSPDGFSAPYQEGRAAFLRGDSQDACGYEEPERRKWILGWKDAYARATSTAEAKAHSSPSNSAARNLATQGRADVLKVHEERVLRILDELMEAVQLELGDVTREYAEFSNSGFARMSVEDQTAKHVEFKTRMSDANGAARNIALARTHIEDGFMRAVRSIFRPKRIDGEL
jgi:ribosome modulation factor